MTSQHATVVTGVQATCMWNRLEAAQCCHLEMERQLTEENSRQKQLRVAEHIRRAAKRSLYLFKFT